MSRPTSLKVALAQTCPIITEVGAPSRIPFEALERNLVDARKKVEAVAGCADVIVFPEYCLQGLVNEGRQYLTYPSQHLLGFMADLAEIHDISIVGTIVHDDDTGSSPSKPATSPFAHLSAKGSDVSPRSTKVQEEWSSYVERNPVGAHSPALSNTAFFIEGGTGKVVAQYVKRNLWHPEREYLSPGEESHQVFDTKWGKCGFVICWDVSHPSCGQVLSDQGVDIVFAPTYWIGFDSDPIIRKHHSHPPSYELEVISALSYARSFETETVWILCNAGGDGKEAYIGGSSVWAPLKGKIGGCKDEKVEVTVVDVDLNVLKDSRAFYKVKEDYSKRELM